MSLLVYVIIFSVALRLSSFFSQKELRTRRLMVALYLWCWLFAFLLLRYPAIATDKGLAFLLLGILPFLFAYSYWVYLKTGQPKRGNSLVWRLLAIGMTIVALISLSDEIDRHYLSGHACEPPDIVESIMFSSLIIIPMILKGNCDEMKERGMWKYF